MKRTGGAAVVACLLWLTAGLATATCASPPEEIYYGQTVQREIDTPEDIDTFFFWCRWEGFTVRVTRDGGSLEPRVRVLRGDGSVAVDRNGEYWVQISTGLGRETVTIEVSSRNGTTGRYTLVLERTDPATGAQRDFGDPIAVNIWPRGAVQHYIFPALGSDLVTLQVTDGIYGAVELLSPTGQYLGVAWDDLWGNVPLEIELVEAGWYQLIARSADYDHRMATGTFYVSLERHGKPLVEVFLNQTSFQTGEELQVSLHVVNGPDPQEVEVRCYVEQPDESLRQLVSVPTQWLPAHADVTVPVLSYTFNGSEPAGTYLVGARLMEPITAHSWSLDEKTFSFAP